MTCQELKKLLHIEVQYLRKEIEKDRHYMGEKQHRFISWHEAEVHYINNHLDGWACGFKDAYCNLICKDPCEFKRELKDKDKVNMDQESEYWERFR